MSKKIVIKGKIKIDNHAYSKDLGYHVLVYLSTTKGESLELGEHFRKWENQKIKLIIKK